MKPIVTVIVLAMSLILIADEPLLSEENGSVKQVATGFSLTEGVCGRGDGTVYFSDFPNNRIFRWNAETGVETVRENSHKTNGLAMDREGRLLMCEQNTRRITRLNQKGEIETVVARGEVFDLNGPNDIAVGPNGQIYFTDPQFSVHRKYRNFVRGVFVFSEGKVKTLTTDLAGPNGIEVSGDGRELYVGDTTRNTIWKFRLSPDGLSIEEGSPFSTSVKPDGMVLGPEGNLYVAEFEQGRVQVISPKGKHLRYIAIPEVTTTNCYYESQTRTLYVTAGFSLYSVKL